MQVYNVMSRFLHTKSVKNILFEDFEMNVIYFEE